MEARLRRVVATLALTLCLLGCRSEVPFTIAGDLYWTGGEGCPSSAYLVGTLVIDRDRLVLQDDRGVMTGLTWRGSYRARMAGDQVEIVDGRTVVATSGHRYKLGGTWAPQWGGWWACGEVIPEPG
jgi:hypothetical protein